MPHSYGNVIQFVWILANVSSYVAFNNLWIRVNGIRTFRIRGKSLLKLYSLNQTFFNIWYFNQVKMFMVLLLSTFRHEQNDWHFVYIYESNSMWGILVIRFHLHWTLLLSEYLTKVSIRFSNSVDVIPKHLSVVIRFIHGILMSSLPIKNPIFLICLS